MTQFPSCSPSLLSEPIPRTGSGSANAPPAGEGAAGRLGEGALATTVTTVARYPLTMDYKSF